MFAGCGATLEQYLGIPQWIGAIGLGIIAYAVIWFGLESVTNVLSCVGLIIIGFVVLIGVYCFVAQGLVKLQMEQRKSANMWTTAMSISPVYLGLKIRFCQGHGILAPLS